MVTNRYVPEHLRLHDPTSGVPLLFGRQFGERPRPGHELHDQVLDLVRSFERVAKPAVALSAHLDRDIALRGELPGTDWHSVPCNASAFDLLHRSDERDVPVGGF